MQHTDLEATARVARGQWGRTKVTLQVHLRLELVKEEEMDGQVII